MSLRLYQGTNAHASVGAVPGLLYRRTSNNGIRVLIIFSYVQHVGIFLLALVLVFAAQHMYFCFYFYMYMFVPNGSVRTRVPNSQSLLYNAAWLVKFALTTCMYAKTIPPDGLWKAWFYGSYVIWPIFKTVIEALWFHGIAGFDMAASDIQHGTLTHMYVCMYVCVCMYTRTYMY